MKCAVIGHGYWGKNIARVISQSADFHLDTVCDQNPKALGAVKKLYPSAKTVSSIDEIGKDIELVAIVTPTASHFPTAKKFLEQGKHILVTKPFTRTYEEAEELVAIADKNNLTIFVDHTFIFNPAVRKMKEMLPRIGKPLFVISQRLNLGLYQPDVNVIYDLMPHDLSIICYLFGAAVTKAQTMAHKSLGLPQEDVAHSSFEMDTGIRGMVSVSWLSPFKVRQFFIVGTEGMLSYDDVEVSEKIKLYDRGVSLDSLSNPDSIEAYTSRISYRSGDLYCPAIPNYEALALEMNELKKAIGDKAVRTEYNKLNLNIMKSLTTILRATQ